MYNSFETKYFKLFSCTILVMRPEIPQNLKDTAIQLYLKGVSRNEIASITAISQGSVSNIVAEWKRGLTIPLADDLRDLGIMLKNANMTAPQCAKGFRAVQILEGLGINEDDLGSFISEIYQRCKEIGLDSHKVADNVKQLLKLSESIPLWQIPEYISDKTREKENLEESIRCLREQESQARMSLERALKYRKLSLERLNDFCELRYRLEETGISLDSIEPFVKALEGAKKLGYDTDRMVRMLSSFDVSLLMQAELEKSISFQEMKLKELKDSCVLAETQLSIHNQTLTNYRHLEWMGLGIPQLISLYHTIQEVASANNIPHHEAVQKFLKDVEENYAAQLGYEGKVRALRSEKEKTVAELRYLRATLGSSIGVAAAMFLGELLTLGFTENEVLEVANTLKSKPKESTDKAPIHVALNKAAEGSIQDKQLVNHDVDLPKLAGQMSFQPPSFFYPIEPSFMPPHVTTPPIAPTLL